MSRVALIRELVEKAGEGPVAEVLLRQWIADRSHRGWGRLHARLAVAPVVRFPERKGLVR